MFDLNLLTMSYVLALYHIVFATKHRTMAISQASCRELYQVISSIVKDYHSELLRIDGDPCHIHLLIDLHPTMALADMVKEIKRKSSIWCTQTKKFPLFPGWGKEYFANSVSPKDAENVKIYISNQKIHHLAFPFDSEIKKLVEYLGMQFFESSD